MLKSIMKYKGGNACSLVNNRERSIIERGIFLLAEEIKALSHNSIWRSNRALS